MRTKVPMSIDESDQARSYRNKDQQQHQKDRSLTHKEVFLILRYRKWKGSHLLSNAKKSVNLGRRASNNITDSTNKDLLAGSYSYIIFLYKNVQTVLPSPPSFRFKVESSYGEVNAQGWRFFEVSLKGGHDN